MTKKIFILFLVAFAFCAPLPIMAFTSSQVINHGAPEINIAQNEFDKLLLDITIPSGNLGQSDVLETISVQNEGTARDREDIARLILWQDKGEVGFQGMAIDQKIGEFDFESNRYSWYLKNLSVEVPSDGLRLFVSVETTQGVSNYKYFKMKLSGLLDNNNNKQYDFGDLGVFLKSANNGPTGPVVVNAHSQTIRLFTVDSLAPKAVISLPQGNEVIATSTYLIKGLVRDQGGSGIKTLEVGIKKDGQDEVWQSAQIGQIEGLEYPWQFNWQNVAEGNYTLRVKSADFNFGSSVSEQQVKVSVILPVVIPPIVESPIVQPPVVPPPVVDEKAEQIASLKAQIAQVQQMIIQLISQLIALLQAELSD